ncbi:hypothetical protein XMD509_002392 [Marinobacterium sp. xm-d-509]|nr:hypothetical protein [Marinobacterium sp. xm-d-509]
MDGCLLAEAAVELRGLAGLGHIGATEPQGAARGGGLAFQHESTEFTEFGQFQHVQ